MAHSKTSVDSSPTPFLPAQRNNQLSGESSSFECPQPNMGHSPSPYGIPTRANNSSSYDPRSIQAQTTHASSYQHPQPSSQYFTHPQSNGSAPWTPAPTTSDVHNHKSRSNSVSSLTSAASSMVSQYQPPFAHPEMLSRYLTINTAESSLVHEARRAISEGLVREGEDMFVKKCEEQGWRVWGLNGEYNGGGQDRSDGSRTLGRSKDGGIVEDERR